MTRSRVHEDEESKEHIIHLLTTVWKFLMLRVIFQVGLAYDVPVPKSCSMAQSKVLKIIKDALKRAKNEIIHIFHVILWRYIKLPLKNRMSLRTRFNCQQPFQFNSLLSTFLFSAIINRFSIFFFNAWLINVHKISCFDFFFLLCFYIPV